MHTIKGNVFVTKLEGGQDGLHQAGTKWDASDKSKVITFHYVCYKCIQIQDEIMLVDSICHSKM